MLALADGHLEDYRRAIAGKLSADVQLGLAYDAIRISATAALRAAGYRVVRGGSEHYRTIEALEFSIDPQKKIIPTLDKLRRKRNIGSYDDFGVVSQGEADHCGKMAVRVREKVEIRRNHADKIAWRTTILTRHLSARDVGGAKVRRLIRFLPLTSGLPKPINLGKDLGKKWSSGP